jgi:hypothetical protein
MHTVVIGAQVDAEKPSIDVVVGTFEPAPKILHGDDRQIAVDEEAVAAVVGIQRRTVGIEVLAYRVDGRDAAFDHGEETLIRVEATVFVPVHPHAAQVRGEHENEQ